MGISIGTDPEVFVKCDGAIIPGIGLIGGSKECPRETEFGAVQEDNVLAEFNIPPSGNSDEFLNNITLVMSDLNNILDQHNCCTEIVSSHEFDFETLLSYGPDAMQFGCDPDYNCWTKEKNPTPSDFSGLRTAGGHVHIGYDNPDPETSYQVAMMCDVFLGIPSLLLDNDTNRRKLYGKAGACRIKAYGVEYRSLSNFWLKVSTVTKWVYNQAVHCAENLHELEGILEYIDGDEIQRIINEGDTDKAKQVVAVLGINMPEV